MGRRHDHRDPRGLGVRRILALEQLHDDGSIDFGHLHGPDRHCACGERGANVDTGQLKLGGAPAQARADYSLRVLSCARRVDLSVLVNGEPIQANWQAPVGRGGGKVK